MRQRRVKERELSGKTPVFSGAAVGNAAFKGAKALIFQTDVATSVCIECRAAATAPAWLQTRLVFVAVAAVIGPTALAGINQVDGLWELYQSRDFFALRDALPSPRPDENPRIAYLRAATDAAFNHYDSSSNLLEALLQRPLLEHSLVLSARKLLLLNLRERSLYSIAASAADLPNDRSKDNPEDSDLRNSADLMATVADVAALEVVRSGPPQPLALSKEGLFDLQINGHATQLGLDTAANLSFIPRSLATAAGLRLRPSNVQVGTSTGDKLTAEIAAADLTIGTATIRNVLFLVFPDEALTMSDGFVVPGMVGFPALLALKGFRRDIDSITFGPWLETLPSNLALNGSDILTRISFHGVKLICRVDSGADTTTFYEPFFRRFHKQFNGVPGEAKIGGVGGAKMIPAYRPEKVQFRVAGRLVTAVHSYVLTEPILGPDDNYLFCNIGRNVLNQFGAYTIDLGNLTLRLGAPAAPKP